MGPSSAARWYKCPGSLRVELPGDDGPNDAADRGSLGHAMVEAWLHNNAIDPGWKQLFDSYTDDERDVLADQVEFVLTKLNELFEDCWKIVATEVKIQDDIVEEHGGTIDLVLARGCAIMVVDYKFGRIPVDVQRNRQITCYLNLALQRFAPGDQQFATEPFRHFHGMIIQPHVRSAEWATWSKEDLDEARLAMIDVSLRDELIAGEHCDDTYCPLRNQCTVHANWLLAEARAEFDTVVQVAGSTKLTREEKAERLAKMHKIGKAAAELQKGTSDALKALHNDGVDLSPFDLCVRTSTRYSGRNLDLEAIADEFDVPITKISKPDTPNKIAKVVGCEREDLIRFGAKATETRTLTSGKADIYEIDEFEDLTAEM